VTFTALLALTWLARFTGFTLLAWLTCVASLLRGLFVVDMLCRTFFTRCAVATLTAVTAVAVA
jgi:hypothetical protein